MRVGIVLVTTWLRGSIDHDGYAHALRKLGHEPVLFCRKNGAGNADFKVVEVSLKQQCEVEFWSSQRMDVVIVWNWLRGAALVKSLKRAGSTVILRADSDGYASEYVYPHFLLRRTIANGRTVRQRMGLCKAWFLRKFRVNRQTDIDLLQTIRYADRVVIESDEAKNALSYIVARYGMRDLESRIHVVPHSVRREFLTTSVEPERSRKIFCGGRWNDPQKGANLLSRVLHLACTLDRGLEVVLLGKGAENAFSLLASRFPNVRCLGMQSAERVRYELGRSRVFLASSVWESQPIGALEAVCLGCSVVAPSMPGFDSICHSGPFGRTVRTPHPVELVRAVQAEFTSWEQGERSSIEISRYWRERVSPEVVVSRLMEVA